MRSAPPQLARHGDPSLIPESVLTYPLTDLFRQNYRADLAQQHVVGISQFHRIQASPGFRAAASYVADQLAAAGLEVAIRRYPADGQHAYWGQPGFLEWECEDATLQTLDQYGQASETLCDFGAIATSLIQRSISVEGDFEVVAPLGKGGTAPADYDGVDVAGRMVLTSRPVDQVHHLAVRQLGAAGILFDGMSLGGRSELDLPDARQYTSFWWAGASEPDGWGFVLSPRQGRRLRGQLARGQMVRVRAAVHSRFHPGFFEVVDARIPGQDEAGEEILLVSHLCHPRPGAHDNGSGAAVLIEAAATLARLIGGGSLPQPSRGIRFLWPPEMSGTYAWCAEHEAEIRAGRWLAGLNLDMVGADQCQTGSTWQFINVPLAASSFTDHLLAWLGEPFLDGQRHQEIPFSAGSDHYILSDPTVGIPTPMLGQWPDKFYHTSADTPDKVSAGSLGRSGALAAAYAYWLATAGHAEALWLGHWMITRFAVQAGRESLECLERLNVIPADDQARRIRHLAEHRRRSTFREERMCAALETLVRLDPRVQRQVDELCSSVHETAERELHWARDRFDSGPSALPALSEQPEEPPAWEAQWRYEAQRLIARRIGHGPVAASMALQAQAKELLPAWWDLTERAGDELHDMSALAEYWADGNRSVAEIADLISLETGRPANDLPLRYLKLLAQAGLVELDESS
jgi:aminopeptidase YwaD